MVPVVRMEGVKVIRFGEIFKEFPPVFNAHPHLCIFKIRQETNEEDEAG